MIRTEEETYLERVIKSQIEPLKEEIKTLKLELIQLKQELVLKDESPLSLAFRITKAKKHKTKQNKT